MSLKEPYAKQPISVNGIVGKHWLSWFQDISNLIGKRPFPLASYTVSGVPSASGNSNSLIYVSDETGGATLAFSDGTNWRRVQDRAIIS